MKYQVTGAYSQSVTSWIILGNPGCETINSSIRSVKSSSVVTIVHTQSEKKIISTTTMNNIINQLCVNNRPQSTFPANQQPIKDPVLGFNFPIESDPFSIVVLGQL
jgi:hypothetical protein